MIDHDFDHQKAETFWTFAELQKQGVEANQSINLDLEFVAGDGADSEAAIRGLKMFGYQATRSENGGLTITVADVSFTAEDIWLHEERTTKIVLERGFLPDGWGFWAS